jgi:hypothetical protein
MTSSTVFPAENGSESKETGAKTVAERVLVDMDEYRATVPLWKRVWKHSLTQMLLMSIQVLCRPDMGDGTPVNVHIM